MKILVFHSWGIGDMIMATPMIRSLFLSGHDVELIVTTHAVRSIIHEAPFIAKLHVIRSVKDYFYFLIRHRKRFDVLIATLGINSTKVNVLGKLLGIKTVYSAQAQLHQHHIDQNLHLASPLLRISESTPYAYQAPKNENILSYLNRNKKNIGFAVGSGHRQTFKRWPIEYYLELSKRFNQANIIIFIGPDEDELENLDWPNNAVVIKHLKIEYVSTLISSLDFLIGNDNGLMHLGYAHQISTYTLFGMTDPLEIGGYYRHNYSIVGNLECAPCFNGNTSKISCKTRECLSILTPQMIYDTIVSDLQSQGISL